MLLARPGVRWRAADASFGAVESKLSVLEPHDALARGRQGIPRRRLAQRRLGRRVVASPEVLERVEALRGAELALQAVEELGVVDLAAAALAQELALERVEGVDVVAGEPRHARLVGRVPGVDAGEVGVDVVQQLHALGAGLAQHPGLTRDDPLGLLAGRELVEVGDQVDGRRSGGVDGRGEAVEAGLVEQQVTVLGDRVAGAEGHVVVGLPVDVGDVEGVAADLDAGPAGDRLGADDRVAGVERLGLEVVRQLRVGDVVAQRGERVVHLRLARGAGGAGVLGLARGEDVERRRGGVLGQRRCGQAEDEHGDEKTQLATHTNSFSFPEIPARMVEPTNVYRPEL